MTNKKRLERRHAMLSLSLMTYGINKVINKPQTATEKVFGNEYDGYLTLLRSNNF